MANSKLQILVFGDQTELSEHYLRRLLRDAKDSSLLSDFFRRCAHDLRKEISMLSREEQNQLPNFTTIHELVEYGCRKEFSDDVINGVLVCLSQLGSFIR